MGMTISTILAYGIDLGGPSQGWKFREAEDGVWVPKWRDHGSIISSAETLLLADAGVFDDSTTLEEELGLEFVAYRAPGHASWMLVAWHETIYPGDIKQIAWPWLNHERIEQDWDAKLIRALDVMGVNSADGGPAWLMTSYID